MTELHCYWVDLPGTKCQASAGPVRDDGGFGYYEIRFITGELPKTWLPREVPHGR